ncbi:MAG: chromosome segregation protein SMC [Candidatus Kapaibacterium sp.]|nr:MAG: chromosome segregation protein SMC [Candidatus Kapabacteria bacterium]
MYLSQIEVLGFKSFANKTQVKFKPGMTAIVGPNGCGKTNVVDALRWVLGEQKASTLRSDKMYDVIFNGTKNRRPLGLAEVSITIDNNRSVLPSEYAEVKVTRRLFRSGESQYLLNNTECRLRDITDLFMDTGLGPDAYSVIELKMIETILSNRTDERRRLFEEAAGVTKYKTRRRETERKLESIQTDLSRINDIVIEVEKTVRSLSRQAAKAKIAAEIGAKLKAVERVLLQYEYAEILKLVAPIEEQIRAESAAKERFEQEVQGAEAMLADLETRQTEIQSRLQNAEAVFVEMQRGLMGAQQERAVANERLSALQKSRERALREMDDITHSIEQATVRLSESRAQADNAEHECESAESEFNRTKSLETEINAQVQNSRANVRAENDAVMNYLNQITAARANSERTIASINSLKRRIEETERSIQQQEEKLLTTKRDHEAATARGSEHDATIRRTEEELRHAQETLETVQAEISSAERDASSIQAEMSRKSASLEFLQGLVNTADTAQFLMKTADWHTTRRTTFAEALSADAQYRVALESALGEAANYLVVNTSNEAHSAIAALRAHGKGKATFLCLDRVPSIDAPSGTMQFGEDVLGYLSELINISNEAAFSEEQRQHLRQAVRGAVGGMLVTTTAEAAKRVVEQGLADAAVSLDGECIRKSGLHKGGGTNPTEGATIGKQGQIETLKQELQGLQERLSGVRFTIQEKTALRKELNPNRIADALRQAEAAKSKHAQSVAQLGFQVDSLEETIDHKNEDISRFTSEIQALQAAQVSAGMDGQEIEELTARKSEAESRLHAAQHALAAVEEEFARLQDESREAEMQFVEEKSHLRSLQNDVQRLEQEIIALEERSHKRAEEAVSAEREQQDLEAHFTDMDNSLQAAQEATDTASIARDAVLQEQTDVRKELQEASEEARSTRRELEGATSRLHKAELDMSNLTNRVTTYRERASEDFQLDFTQENITSESLLEAAKADNTLLFEDGKFEIGRLRSEVKSLKEQIKSIGAVNPLAIEEYDRENERLLFMEAQLKDLQESEHTLKQTIQEINQTAQKQFFDIFERVRTNFIHIFKTLFNEGDEADLQIEEGDPLEAPIKIIAKPRGKRPHSIEMLSGGEKTLTAIALLFAIYLVKPSPFCILDEVDAPLDDANIGRYVRLIKKFSETTQFIMITHNKLTMEAAETLYGVTMEEEGISKIVTVQFNQYLGDGNFAEETATAPKAAKAKPMREEALEMV